MNGIILRSLWLMKIDDVFRWSLNGSTEQGEHCQGAGHWAVTQRALLLMVK